LDFLRIHTTSPVLTVVPLHIISTITMTISRNNNTIIVLYYTRVPLENALYVHIVESIYCVKYNNIIIIQYNCNWVNLHLRIVYIGPQPQSYCDQIGTYIGVIKSFSPLTDKTNRYRRHNRHKTSDCDKLVWILLKFLNIKYLMWYGRVEIFY
jgi:hypothetical protein